MKLRCLNVHFKLGNHCNGVIRKYLICLIALVFICAQQKVSGQNYIPNIEGAWFLCEYAHSKIPPPDHCAMLDDDGFLIKDGLVHHIKVKNSREVRCRGGRIGNCLRQGTGTYRAQRYSIGPIGVESDKLSVQFLGCTQFYNIIAQEGFFELRPGKERCYWTPDKRYYLSRFSGHLEFIK